MQVIFIDQILAMHILNNERLKQKVQRKKHAIFNFHASALFFREVQIADH